MAYRVRARNGEALVAEGSGQVSTTRIPLVSGLCVPTLHWVRDAGLLLSGNKS